MAEIFNIEQIRKCVEDDGRQIGEGFNKNGEGESWKTAECWIGI